MRVRPDIWGHDNFWPFDHFLGVSEETDTWDFLTTLGLEIYILSEKSQCLCYRILAEEKAHSRGSKGGNHPLERIFYLIF